MKALIAVNQRFCVERNAMLFNQQVYAFQHEIQFKGSADRIG